MRELLEGLQIDRRGDSPSRPPSRGPRRPTWQRKGLFAAAILAVVAATASTYVVSDRPPLVQVLTVTASATAPAAQLTAGGYVRDARVVYVTPKVAGRIVSLSVREGDQVAAGGEIAALDGRDLAREVAEARANLEMASANLRKLEAGSRADEIAESQARVQALAAAQERAEREAVRAKALFADGLVTAQALDQVETEARAGARTVEAARHALRRLETGPRREDIDSARAAVEAARAHLSSATDKLAYTRVLAPVAGRVLRKFRNVGDFVSPDVAFIEGYETVAVGSPVVSLAASGDQEVAADINETDIAKVRLGQQVSMTPNAYPEDTLSGTVTEISPRADKNKNTVEVKVRLAQRARVLPYDLSVKLNFLGADTTTRDAPAIRIPATAVRRQGSTAFVLAVSGSRVVSRAIQVGPGSGDGVVVTSGLSPGDLVIVGGPRGVSEGMSVRVR